MVKHPWKVAQLLAEAKKVCKTAVKTDNGGEPEDAGTKETQDTETSTKAERGKKRKHKKDEVRKNKSTKKKEKDHTPDDEEIEQAEDTPSGEMRV